MDLRHARTFVTVAELGTVSKAAQQLRIAQPALSRQISDLEQELGFRLFDRIGRRLALTSEGEQFLGDCRGLLNHASAVGERAELLRQGDTGVLKVAASPQHIESVLSQFLHRYAQQYPNVQVQMFEAAGRESLAMLERGEIHLAQNLLHAVEPNDSRVAILQLQPVELLSVSHPSLILGRRGSIEIDELLAHPLLLMDSEFVVRRTFDAACRVAGIKPVVRFTSRAPHTLLALAEAGHGVAVIPSQLRTSGYRLRIARITHRQKPLSEPLAMLWDRRRPLPRYAADYCKMLSEYVREIFPITAPSISKPSAKRTGSGGARR
ncbi:MAG TPA: LysR family transcriptional regulator [Bradyrhizobium sp.]|nr:LysR family transcriptional regulator [Bradyrhizobium sp.]